MKKIIYIFIIVILLTGCKFYDEYEMPEEVDFTLTDSKFEVYSNHTINDLVEETNAEILNGDKELKTTKTGEKETEIEYKYGKRTYKYKVTYNIYDDKAPVIMKYKSEQYTNINEEIDLCDVVVPIDNYDRSLKCSIDGDYDFNVGGIYPLKYIVKDKAGNQSEEVFNLFVIDPTATTDDDSSNDDTPTEIPTEEPSTEEYSYILFNDIEKEYKTKDTMIGIDVSAWQDAVDYEKVKADGAEFVIIRMAYNLEDDNEIYLDKRFEENLNNAKKAGLKVGVYVYTNASTKEEVIKQAKFIRKNLNKTKLDFPIAYDFENWSNFRSYKMNTHDLLSRVNEFKDELSKDGYDVMIYSSKWYLENVWLTGDHDIWLAHYTDHTDYAGEYKIWQICSDGIIDGIEGYVDIDILYK